MMLTGSVWSRTPLSVCATLMMLPFTAAGQGVPAGTVVENTATVSYEYAGAGASVDTNAASFIVAERLDVVVTRQGAAVPVEAGDVNRVLLFRVTNTGNGSEAFSLVLDSALPGDDFDPVPAATAIYFDTDGSGDLNTGDVAYQPGTNDPVLGPDTSIDVLVVNDIPANVSNGALGRSELTATAVTGSGAPGTGFAGAGDGGGIAVVGASGASDDEVGEYLVDDIEIAFTKTQSVADPSGGSEPVSGATITYTISVEVQSTGVVSAAAVRDPIPQYTTFAPGSIALNGVLLSDAADADAGEFDETGAPTVVVRLGDLTMADGTQTVEFSVTID